MKTDKDHIITGDKLFERIIKLYWVIYGLSLVFIGLISGATFLVVTKVNSIDKKIIIIDKDFDWRLSILEDMHPIKPKKGDPK